MRAVIGIVALAAACVAVACGQGDRASLRATQDRAPGAGLAWVRQRPKVTIGGIRLTLADVAEVDALDPASAARLRAIDLGEIPSKGRQLILSRDTLVETVARARLGQEIRWEGADLTEVGLNVYSISGEEIEALGRRHVARALGERGTDARFGPGAPPRAFECVAGRWSTRVFVRAAQKERYFGAVRLELVALADGVERASVPFVIEVDRNGHVLVAARDLAPGSPIKAEDVSPVERNLAAVGPDSVDAPERVVGMVLARRVPAGQVLTTRDIRLPSVIERDDVVQIRFRSGALKVTGLGRAQAAGAPGERIPIINLSSHKTVHATVVDSRTVEVAAGTDS